jgi:hypothetical protein
VAYVVDVPTDDPSIGTWVEVCAVVRAHDAHDAPVLPGNLEVHLVDRWLVEHSGVARRRMSTDVHRVDLDVEQDWWRTDHGGGVEPIAEFVDHLTAHVSLRAGEQLAATADTPVLSGSWGALGRD